MKTLSFLLFLIILIGAPIGFLFVAMEGAPTVPPLPTATASDAAQTRIAIKKMRAALDPEKNVRRLAFTEDELNSLFIVAARGLPFLRGRARVVGGAVQFAISAGHPRMPGNGWLNFNTAIAADRNGLKITRVRLGRFDLPQKMVIPLLGYGLDAALGDGLGGVALRSISRVAVRGRTVSLGIALKRDDREALLVASRGRLHRTTPFGTVQDVRVYYASMEEAVAKGKLPARGSFVPYLRHALDLAQIRGGHGDAATEMRSAMLAVAIYCGERKLQVLVGKVIPEHTKKVLPPCFRSTLGGRGDLRQHFIVSAALKIASDSGMAFAIGEFKELLDSNRGGSGFSFDDIAADRAGIRFAETLFAGGKRAELKTSKLDQLRSEKAIMPSIKGLPSGMTEARNSNAASATSTATATKTSWRSSTNASTNWPSTPAGEGVSKYFRVILKTRSPSAAIAAPRLQGYSATLIAYSSWVEMLTKHGRRPRNPRVGAWRSLVAHLLWEQGVGGSNPLAPTSLGK